VEAPIPAREEPTTVALRKVPRSAKRPPPEPLEASRFEWPPSHTVPELVRRRSCRRREVHPLRHFLRVGVPEMPVGLGHKHAAVLVPHPCGDGLEIHAGFDGVAHKEVPHSVVPEVRESRLLAGRGQSLLGRGDGDDPVGVLGERRFLGEHFGTHLVPDPLQERDHCREERHRPRFVVLGPQLSPGDGEETSVPIDVRPTDRDSFPETHPGQGQQLHEVRGVVGPGIQLPKSGEECPELLPGGNDHLGFLQALPCDEDRRILQDEAVPLGHGEHGAERLQVVVERGGADSGVAAEHPFLAEPKGDVPDRKIPEGRGEIVDAGLAAAERRRLEPGREVREPPLGDLAEGEVAGARGVGEAPDLEPEIRKAAVRERTVFGLQRAAKLLAATFQQRVVSP
jgi:hypothetical protein